MIYGEFVEQTHVNAVRISSMIIQLHFVVEGLGDGDVALRIFFSEEEANEYSNKLELENLILSEEYLLEVDENGKFIQKKYRNHQGEII